MTKHRFTYDKLQVRHAACFLKDNNPSFKDATSAEVSIMESLRRVAGKYPETFATSTGGYFVIADPIVPASDDEEIFLEVWVNASVCKTPIYESLPVSP